MDIEMARQLLNEYIDNNEEHPEINKQYYFRAFRSALDQGETPSMALAIAKKIFTFSGEGEPSVGDVLASNGLISREDEEDGR